MKRIAILGSTGSIGKSTLAVARHLKDSIAVTALAAKSNIALLEEQAREFQPQFVCVYEKALAKELQSRLPHIPVVAGLEGLISTATHSDVDLVLSGMVGTIGLIPTISAICAGKDIALANKEVLVSGGEFVTSLARKHHVALLPVDSEHSAIFQCLQGENPKTIRRIILTASGGPFRNYNEEQLQQITVEKALGHPTWKMGPKITVDSSTLMNKGLEVIEAHWLFHLPLEQIEVVIHPQSLIHSMVEFTDGAILAQLSEPDMISPIQYALTYPNRLPGMMPPFDFLKERTLQFYKPDRQKFRCLQLAYDAIKYGGSLPCYMNAANEVLVMRFLQKQVAWSDIAVKLEKLMSQHDSKPLSSLEDILAIDELARIEATEA